MILKVHLLRVIINYQKNYSPKIIPIRAVFRTKSVRKSEITVRKCPKIVSENVFYSFVSRITSFSSLVRKCFDIIILWEVMSRGRPLNQVWKYYDAHLACKSCGYHTHCHKPARAINHFKNCAAFKLKILQGEEEAPTFMSRVRDTAQATSLPHR